MERRTYLGSLGAASVTGLAGLAGCLDDAMGTVGLGDDSDTVLSPPDQTRGDPSHPIHGEAFPDFAIPDRLPTRPSHSRISSATAHFSSRFSSLLVRTVPVPHC